MQFPHYLLYVSTGKEAHRGDWRFALQAADASARLEVADTEPGVQGERLELLAVVRGLEALEQPSRVTLITSSRYVRRGIVEGLAEWRDNGWRWEAYGRFVPIKHLDLWQRLDHALSVHRVELREFRWDGPHVPLVQHAAVRQAEIQQTAVRQSLVPAGVGGRACDPRLTAHRHDTHQPTAGRRFSAPAGVPTSGPQANWSTTPRFDQDPRAWQVPPAGTLPTSGPATPRLEPCAAGLC